MFVHHHQFLLSLRGQKALTKHRHLVLFSATLLTSLQLFPFSNVSLWTVLRHVCLGLPLLAFPLRVPIQGLSFDSFMSFLQCMSYPITFASLDLRGHLDFLCPSPTFFI